MAAMRLALALLGLLVYSWWVAVQMMGGFTTVGLKSVFNSTWLHV
jgi:hypothetical protein